MNSRKKKARVAGLIYLSMALTAPFGFLYVPSKLIVQGDATATANNITAHEMLFRLGIVSGLVSGVIFLFTVLALHELLKDVNQRLAVQMVTLVLVSVAIIFVNELNNLAALMLLSGADYLSAFPADQLHALALQFLRLHERGLVVNEIFWGLWLLPFGLLVFRSGFLPRFLGIWLVLNGIAYLVSSFTALLLPDYQDVVSLAVMPAVLGEVAIVLWLLIKGAKEQPLDAPAS